MILIACMDDNRGMMFNRRRQSRDRIVCEDILAHTDGHILRMNSYSAKLFSDAPEGRILVDEEFLSLAQEGEFCFVESLLPPSDHIEAMILYRWNRDYPADVYFDLPLNEGWNLTETVEFAGSSHPIITKEVYLK